MEENTILILSAIVLIIILMYMVYNLSKANTINTIGFGKLSENINQMGGKIVSIKHITNEIISDFYSKINNSGIVATELSGESQCVHTFDNLNSGDLIQLYARPSGTYIYHYGTEFTFTMFVIYEDLLITVIPSDRLVYYQQGGGNARSGKDGAFSHRFVFMVNKNFDFKNLGLFLQVK